MQSDPGQIEILYQMGMLLKFNALSQEQSLPWRSLVSPAPKMKPNLMQLAIRSFSTAVQLALSNQGMKYEVTRLILNQERNIS